MRMAACAWKVCGMREPQNIRAVADLQPDYMGFIFYEASPRFVGPAFNIPSDLPEHIKRVGVFVNEQRSRVEELIEKHRLDFVQLHGEESPAVAAELKKKTGIIKVFRVDEDFDFGVTAAYEHIADFFLFDTKGAFYGGNAIRFDWGLLKHYTGRVPFFLSGGISPANIAEVTKIDHTQFYAIDINSGVEEQPARKQLDKIKDVLKTLNKTEP